MLSVRLKTKIEKIELTFFLNRTIFNLEKKRIFCDNPQKL